MTMALTVLGLESSCDDTAAAVITSNGASGHVLSSVVVGQSDVHKAFGGVVPELAARAHAERLDGVIKSALNQSGKTLTEVDLIAVTSGPGLIGGVLSGVVTAKALSAVTNTPMIGVNHLAGHALTPRMTDAAPYPYLMLLVSGGHCQFLAVLGPETFRRLGGTIDDAPGEAFDKSARLLGLGYPGGPLIESEAKKGHPGRFKLPRPLLDRDGCDMSFSGLKTALRRERDRLIDQNGGITHQDRADLCAAFQEAVSDVLAQKTARALTAFSEIADGNILAVAGGVAANMHLRAALEAVAADAGFSCVAPPLEYCTDNAAMIAWAGAEQYIGGRQDDYALTARPRWPLDQSATPMLGSGKKGAKA